MDNYQNYHCLAVDDVLKKFETSRNGLNSDEIQKRLQKFGPNTIKREQSFSWLTIFINQFKSPLIYILALAGLITWLMKDRTDAIVIFSAVIVNSFVGFLQENKASKALWALKKILKVKTIVIRDGYKKEILQEKLVPGDIIVLNAGDRVGADGRIISVKNLKVNEASLTGEWLSSTKITNVIKENTVINDRKNMVYMGTIIEDGGATAVVTATGSQTEFGKIANLISETKDEETVYQKKLAQFAKKIAGIVIISAILVFILGIVKGTNFIEIFTTSVAIAVAAIPEGLPIAMTVVLALGMQRILKRKGLVRKLSAAEALGSTSIICVDKTGTLTEGKMVLSHIVAGDKELLCDSQKINLNDKNLLAHLRSLEIAAVCSKAYIENPQDEIHDWIIRGRPTDRALTLASIQAGISPTDLEKRNPQLDVLEFNSDVKISASLNKYSAKENILYVMGAPEKILSKSCAIANNNKKNIIDKFELDKLNQGYEKLTKKGLRVLAVAYKYTTKPKIDRAQNIINDLNFVGFIGLRDPLREDTKEAIAQAKLAGLRPIIVTGDHRLTAQAIAKELGLPFADQNTMDGNELKTLSAEALKNKISDVSIFARVEPAQKLQIVDYWQSKGQVVAMTGDGINDSPALKKADIGIALGSGTEITKEVADIVLLNDSFSIIIASIEEGRAIIDNIRKSIVYLISDAFSEVSLIAFSLLVGLPLPVLAAQILWIKLIEDGLPTITLAFEKKEEDLMTQKPLSKNTPLLNYDMKILIAIIAIISVVGLVALYYYLYFYTENSLAHIRTVIFTAMTIITLFNVFSCKSLRQNIWQLNPFSNIYLILSWAVGITALLAALYLPFLQTFLHTKPIDTHDWTIIALLGILNLAVIELTKKYLIIRRKWDK